MTDKSLTLEELEPVDRTSILDSVIQQLEGLIFGGLAPGEALPSEGKLAEALGVSRLTVREATRTLEARGLLEIRQGRRPRVAAPNGALVGDFFKLAVRDVRRALEVHIAVLAASRATKGDIADMEMSINVMRASENDSEAFHAADVRFHENRLRSFAGHQARGGGIEDVIQQHQAILDAVKDRSPKAAAEAMRDHLLQTENDLRTVLQGVPKPE